MKISHSRVVCVLSVAVILGLLAPHAQAADSLDLPVVKPARSCAELGATSLRGVADTEATLATESVNTPKGRFCKATGVIAPAIHYEITLPEEHWTQRYVEAGCGGLCGQMPSGISYVADCAPAQNGEFVIATNDMGHQSAMGSPDQSAFGQDPQKRIDFAYRANHVTTLVAKALIKAFYGQPQKFAYFVGCSDGGREALMEAQRFPEDFDGISAGDPAAFLTQLHSFAGPWGQRANRRADGSVIVLAAKARLVHDAVIAQCDTLSGVKDGILADPRACTFKPQSLRCAANASDTSKCLTGEEVDALNRLYDGASDGQGHLFSFGLQRGAELQMRFPESNAPGGPAGGGGFGAQMVPNLYTAIGSGLQADDLVAFTQANFARMAEFAPLYNATNTNLKPFAARGGKLLLWHGWSDPLIPPGISIAYYQGVQQFMGAAATDRFMRLFMMPGVAHCMGGDGNDQVDWLTPLMSWVELHQAPEKIVAGKSAARAAPMMGGGGAPQPRLLYAKPAPALTATRPVFPYPMVAKYTGKGDPADAANYVPVKSPVRLPQSFGADIGKLIAPDTQKNYVVRDGKLVVSP